MILLIYIYDFWNKACLFTFGMSWNKGFTSYLLNLVSDQALPRANEHIGTIKINTNILISQVNTDEGPTSHSISKNT